MQKIEDLTADLGEEVEFEDNINSGIKYLLGETESPVYVRSRDFDFIKPGGGLISNPGVVAEVVKYLQINREICTGANYLKKYLLLGRFDPLMENEIYIRMLNNLLRFFWYNPAVYDGYTYQRYFMRKKYRTMRIPPEYGRLHRLFLGVYKAYPHPRVYLFANSQTEMLLGLAARVVAARGTPPITGTTLPIILIPVCYGINDSDPGVLKHIYVFAYSNNETKFIKIVVSTNRFPIVENLLSQEKAKEAHKRKSKADTKKAKTLNVTTANFILDEEPDKRLVTYDLIPENLFEKMTRKLEILYQNVYTGDRIESEIYTLSDLEFKARELSHYIEEIITRAY